MTPYYSDDWLTVYQGDCRSVMAEMEPESVHCVVTSPPYWGLRDYGTASWEGGDEGCDHISGPARNDITPERLAERATEYGTGTGPGSAVSGKQFREVCGKCGARRIDAQLGLEPTPEQYVESMVAVFREVRRVLRSDGTVWLNLGDSYANNHPNPNNDDARWEKSGLAGIRSQKYRDTLKAGTGGTVSKVPPGLKNKDLVGIPWRVAFALQADGWYLRSDIIWSKPNPMPESVTDRPTKAHEYLFLLSKSPRYYFDADAVREGGSGRTAGNRHYKYDGLVGHETKQGILDVADKPWPERNLRSVWTIATTPYPGAHFATFPPKLVEPCIKAGTSEKGVCPECGAPWVREVERGDSHYAELGKKNGADFGRSDSQPGNMGNTRTARGTVPSLHAASSPTTGWSPSCAHISPLPPAGAVILGPFAGSGTTGMVAQSLSRRAVLIDLSLDYLGQLMDRNRDIPLGLGA